MIVCKICGTQNTPDATFCSRCHSFLEWNQEKIDVAPSTEPAAVPPSESPGKRPRPAAGPNHALDIALAVDRLTAVPGQESSVDLIVKNSGQVVEAARIEFAGDLARWARLEPAEVNLFPGTSATSRLIFTVPKAFEPNGGPHWFAVRAVSVADATALAQTNGQLDVAHFVEVVAELRPQASRDREVGHHTVDLRNNGNVSSSRRQLRSRR